MEATRPSRSPVLSLVICTRNRVGQLRRCVDAALCVDTKHHWELVLVDNGSTDGTSDYLDSINKVDVGRVSVTTRLEPRIGLSNARNTGWQAASAEIVAFTDDDCYVAHDYLDSIIQVFEENPQAGLVGGRILLFDKKDRRITINESEERREFAPLAFVPAGAIQGANFAFRKVVLDKIGGFDEMLGAGTPFPSEDVDAVAAALWSGVSGIYDPRPVVLHHHGRKTEDDERKLMMYYDAGRGAYYTRYLLKKATARIYFVEWLRTIKRDCVGAVRSRRWPSRSIRELHGGIRFVLAGGVGRARHRRGSLGHEVAPRDRGMFEAE